MAFSPDFLSKMSGRDCCFGVCGGNKEGEYILWGARSHRKKQKFSTLTLRDVTFGSRGCGLKLKLFFKPPPTKKRNSVKDYTLFDPTFTIVYMITFWKS